MITIGGIPLLMHQIFIEHELINGFHVLKDRGYDRYL